MAQGMRCPFGGLPHASSTLAPAHSRDCMLNAHPHAVAGLHTQAHDDHFDCVRSSRHVAVALGDAAQALADTCRTAGTTAVACSRQTVELDLSDASIALLQAALQAAPGASQDGASAGRLIEPDAGRDSQPLRIASVFIILASGLVGGLVPLVMQVSRPRWLWHRALCVTTFLVDI
jgi:hypothetical protein